VEWGFDLVKHDTCGTDYSIHNGGLQNASRRMAEGLWDAGQGKMVYYLDSGNPTSPQRVYNPHQHSVTDTEARLKLATSPKELVWRWVDDEGDAWRAKDGGVRGPHMFKSWFDIEDAWGSTLSNAHNQVRVAEFQRCGQFNNPDMLTAGQGQQTQSEYRAQVGERQCGQGCFP
jgi:hypothetical protein